MKKKIKSKGKNEESYDYDDNDDEISCLLKEGHVIKSNRELKEESLRNLKQQEKSFIKEGTCDECGAYDILFNSKSGFLCGVCKNGFCKK